MRLRIKFTTREFNKLAAENFAVRLTQAKLVNKSNFDNEQKILQIKLSIFKFKRN